MKRIFLIIIIAFQCLAAFAQQAFVTDVSEFPNIPQAYCIYGQSSYGGIPTRENLNLLATLLGDSPDSLLSNGQTLVPEITINVLGSEFRFQPFAYTEPGATRKKNLPLGPKLKKFLSDPFDGEKFDLTLPFNDPNVGLSDRSGCIRVSKNAQSAEYHMAIDFDYNTNTNRTFDIIAPADGVVFTNPESGNLAILHTTKNGKEFLTIYAHLDPASKSHLGNNISIKRGDKIGTLRNVDSLGNPIYTHLHFGVALKGPSGNVNGAHIPEIWYLIDPFGVYDVRKNRNSNETYNYLPENNISSELNGVVTTSVFMTNPINGSLYFKEEDCIPFDPNSLKIVKVSSTEFIIASNISSMLIFPNFEEASRALQIIKRNRYSQRCFIGRPDPSLYYFK